jgi:hypothetical protein
MVNSEPLKLIKYAKIFLEPSNSTHRQYEALRAYFVEGLSSKEAASCFGYTPGSFRLLCHQFRQNPDRQFFLPPTKAPRTSPKKDHARDQVIAIRKQNLSVYDIKRCLEEAGTSLSGRFWRTAAESLLAYLLATGNHTMHGRDFWMRNML